LREAAKALELAAKDALPDYPALLPAVVREAEGALRAIESLRPAAAAAAPPPAPAVDLSSFWSAVRRLRDAAAAADLTAASAAAEGLAQVPPAFADRVAAVRDLVDGYDFEEALQRIDALLADQPSGGST
jgi:hypothetical protein